MGSRSRGRLIPDGGDSPSRARLAPVPKRTSALCLPQPEKRRLLNATRDSKISQLTARGSVLDPLLLRSSLWTTRGGGEYISGTPPTENTLTPITGRSRPSLLSTPTPSHLRSPQSLCRLAWASASSTMLARLSAMALDHSAGRVPRVSDSRAPRPALRSSKALSSVCGIVLLV